MKITLLLAAVLVCSPAFAGVAGRWDVTSVTNDGEKLKSVLTVTESEGKTGATLSMGDQNIPLENVSVSADQIAFRLLWGSTGVNIKAKFEGEKLAGTWTADSGETGPITGVRAAAPASAASTTGFFVGKWKLTVSPPDRDPMKVEMEVKESEGALSATLTTPDGMAIPAKAVAEGSKLTVTIDTGNATYVVKLDRDGEGMKGVASGPNGDAPMTAVR